MPQVPKLVTDAIRFAAWKHTHQVRKDGKTPYISHPFRVMTQLAVGLGITDPEILAAAVLHDTIEDTTADYDDLYHKFGKRVADMVAILTKDKRRFDTDREDEYFALLEKAPAGVKLIKMSDTLDNLLDATTLSPEGAAKAADKGERLLGIYAGKIPAEHAKMLEWIRAAIDALRETKKPAGQEAAPPSLK